MFLIIAALLESTFIVMVHVFHDSCFRAFSVSNKVGNSWEEGGLNGDVLSIVKIPGLIALCFFLVGWIII